MVINTSLVHRLIASQFPQWKELPIDPVGTSGLDNHTFHLGKDMSVRLPSAAEYELQDISFLFLHFIFILIGVYFYERAP